MSLLVTPIYGSYTSPDTPAQPPSCTLIEYAGVRILLDVGMDEGSLSDATLIDRLKWLAEDVLPSIDAILVCDSGLTSIGGVPMLFHLYKMVGGSKMPMVYGTFPTAKLGQMSIYDWHARCSYDGDVRIPFELDDVDEAFSTKRFFTMKYSQIITLKAGGKNALTITPHRAGRYVGACFWVLKRLQDETEVVCAPNYNHAKERHLDACELPKYAGAADVLITRPGGPGGALGRLYSSSVDRRKPILQAQPWTKREGEFVDAIMSTLRLGGNVLVPVDASGRVIELLLLLSAHWKRQRLDAAYGLAWVGPMTWNTSNFAKSQLEWMASPLGRQFDSAMGHPLDFKNIKICSKVSELDDMFAKGLPMTILASGSTLDSGPARDLIIKFADKAENTIILSSPQHCVHRNPIRSIGTPIGEIKTHLSAAAQLLEKWCVAKANGEEMDDSIEIDVLVPKREPLVGDELEKFIIEEEAALKHKLEKEEEEKLLREVELARGRLHLGEDGEPEPSLSSMNVDDSARVQSNVPLASNPPKKKSRFDSSLFLKFSKRKPMCFQIREEAVGISYPDEIGKGVFESSSSTANIIEDDYGIGINLDHFIDIVSGIDSSKTGGKLNDESLRRGFGFSIGGKQAQSNQRSNNIDISENTEEDLQMLEAADLAEGRGIIRGRNGNPPVKVFSVHETLEVLAEIRYIPLEGRVDARSARQSIRALQPRQVVVLGGGQPPPDFISNKDLIHQKDSLSEVSRLCDVVNEVFSSQQVHLNSDNIHVPKKAYYAPEDGETIEFEIGHAAYPARLIDTPYVVQKSEDSTVSLQKGMVFEELQELSLGDYTVSLVDLIATGQKVKDGGAYVLAPRQKSTEEKGTLSTSLRNASRSSMMISDGDVLLTDLRSEIIAQGMKAEYSTHDGFQQLVVSNRIILRRTLEGKINVEGPLCEDFYAVRKIVCSHYVTL